MDFYTCEKDIPISTLEVKKVFEQLDEQNKLYAHHLLKASWHGQRIVFQQVIPISLMNSGIS